MNLDDVASLPTVMDAGQTAAIFDCSVDHLYDLVRRGEAPVEPIRLGRSLRWPTLPVLRLLGVRPEHESPGEANVVPIREGA